MSRPGISKVRAAVTATCIAAVVFTGASYGAGLKTQQEWKEERDKVRELSSDEQIAALESQRSHLISQRDALDTKLNIFNQRVRERNEKTGQP